MADAAVRPPGSRILVVHDDAGLTIVIPPRMGRVVVWCFIMSGFCFLNALVFLCISWRLSS